MRVFIRYAIVGWLCLVVGLTSDIFAKEVSDGCGQYQSYLRFSSAELLKFGNRFLYDANLPDSAMLCFTIVAERNRPDMSRQEQEECFAGWCGRWETNNWGFNNYEACIQDYDRIIELQEIWGIKSARPAYYLALYSVYESNAEQEFQSKSESYDLFKSAFYLAYTLNDKDLAARIFDNMVRVAFTGDEVSLDKEMLMLRNLFGESSQTIQRSVKLYEVLGYMKRGEFSKAVSMIDSVIAFYPRDARNARYLCSALNTKAWLLYKCEDYESAERVWKDAIGVTYRFNRKDMRQALVSTLMVFYKLMERKEKYDEAFTHSILLKDSIWDSHIVKCLQQVKFNIERRDIRKEIALMEYRHRVQRWLIIGALVLIGCFGVFIFYLVKANRKLKERNNTLYEKALDAVSGSGNGLSECDSGQSEDASESVEDQSGQVMSDEAFAILGTKIEDALQSKEIYDKSFSLATLAKLCGSNQKYVSHVVNRKYKCNFQTLVNRLRIHEACRRIDNKRVYGHYSIEGIADSVGFNSRGAFCAAFKKFIGIGAGEYRKISNQRNGGI